MGFLTILGPAMVVVGAFLLIRTRLFLGGASSAEGVVASHRHQGSGGSEASTYNPVVRFEAADGKSYEFEDSGGFSSNRPIEVGTHVPVKYNPSNPSRARIDKPGRLWAAPAALIGAGAVVTALALV